MTNKYIILGIIAVVLIGGFVYFASADKTGKDAVKDSKKITGQTADKTIDSGNGKDKMVEAEKMMEGKAITENIVPPPNPSTNTGTAPGSEFSTKPAPSTSSGSSTPPPPAPKPGAYKDYSAATVEAEQKSGNTVVLFFHATWCPECKAANKAFLERTNEIPSNVTVLKTDYDSNTELKKKYGVTYQHTFVQIDNDENMVTKWNGGDIEALKKNLK